MSEEENTAMIVTIPDSFPAVVADSGGTTFHCGVRQIDLDLITDGQLASDLMVRVLWSSINYKDALAMSPIGRVARISPLVTGIDLVGEVVTDGGSHPAGSLVLAHGYGLGVSHHGGFAHYARVPEAWCLTLPAGLNAREAMTLGTAGFTAAMSIVRLEADGLRPGDGPVLVTGATGGVGSSAVAMLSVLGYEVVASTGKRAHTDWLRGLGASQVIDRIERSDPPKPLSSAHWAAVIDSVGGPGLAQALSELRYGASAAVSGLTGGAGLPTTVLPFILRGVSLRGIDSVDCPLPFREAVWQRIATDLRPADIEALVDRTIQLDEAPGAGADLLSGSRTGRTLVSVS
jgi:acrylyl-CoA reductase (NADPH)